MQSWKQAVIAAVSIATIVGVEMWGSAHLGGCQNPGNEDADGDGILASADCDDFDPDVGAETTFFVDGDGDGFAPTGTTDTQRSCDRPAGYSERIGDCDDSDATINPDAVEICDGIDNNCVDGIDEGFVAGDFQFYYADTDSDGFGDADTVVEACAPPTGFVDNDTDCDDIDPDVHPGADEVCDGIDNNCVDGIDADDPAFIGSTQTFYADTDNDTFGDADVTTVACQAPLGFVDNDTDCDDGATAVHPGATEICDGIDNNCTDGIDEGFVPTCEAPPEGLTIRVVDEDGGVQPDFLAVTDGLNDPIVLTTPASDGVNELAITDANGRWSIVLVCPALQDRRVFGIQGTLAEVDDVTVRCPDIDALDAVVEGVFIVDNPTLAAHVHYGDQSSFIDGDQSLREFSTVARSGAQEDLVLTTSNATFNLIAVAIVRNVAAGTTGLTVNPATDGFVPGTSDINVTTTGFPSTTALFHTERGTTLDVMRYDFSAPPAWRPVPLAQQTSREVHVVRSVEEDFPGEVAITQITKNPGALNVDFTGLSPLAQRTLVASIDTFVVDTTNLPTGLTEVVVTSFDAGTSTQIQHTMLVTPARAAELVEMPSPGTVNGFDSAWALTVPSSAQLRVHDGASAAVITDLLLNSPLGHAGVATVTVGCELAR